MVIVPDVGGGVPTAGNLELRSPLLFADLHQALSHNAK